MDAGTKWALMDASKADEEGWKPTKYEGGIEPEPPKAGKAKVDDRERVEVLLRVTGQVSKSGTCAVTVAGDHEKLMGLGHYHNREFGVFLEGTMILVTFAIDPDGRVKRVIKDIHKATEGEILTLMTKEIERAGLYAADENDDQLIEDFVEEMTTEE
jgi:hypothetical protein